MGQSSVEIGLGGMRQLQAKGYEDEDLLVWTIYAHPTDFPDFYVVRPHSTKLAKPLTVHFKREQLDKVRGALRNLHLTCLPRHEDDDPNIVESWI